MRVLQLANDYFGTALYELLFSALETLGVENVIFVPIHKKNHLYPDAPSNVIQEPCFHHIDRILYYTKQKWMYNALIKHNLMRNIDLIHAHTLFSMGYLAMKLKKEYNIPYVVSVSNTDKNIFFHRMPHLRSCGIEVMRHADRIIFHSPGYMKYLTEKYMPLEEQHSILDKSSIVPFGINDYFLTNIGTIKTRKKNEKIKLVFVGQIRANKNLETVISAARLLMKRGMDVEVRAVGELIDKRYNAIMRRASFLKYFPKCPKEEVLEHLRWGDIFVLPSHTETFGLVYAEAMSQGLPIIYTTGEGFDGHFPPGVIGYPVHSEKPEEIVSAINKILSEYSVMSQRCINLSSVFAWELVSGDIFNAYRSTQNKT